MRPTHFVLFTTTVLVSLGCLLAEAQNQRGQGQKKLPRKEIAGKLVGVQQGLLQVETSDKEPYLVKPSERAKLRVNGTADRKFLSRGQLVQFTVPLDESGKPTREVTRVDVVSPSRDVKPGVTVSAAGIKFDPDKDTKDPGRLYDVTGQVRAANGGKLLVATPAGTLGVAVAEDAAVAFSVANLSLARPGSSIGVKGRLFREVQPSGKGLQPGLLLGDDIQVTILEPLTDKEKDGEKEKGDK